MSVLSKRMKKIHRHFCTAVVLAAGSSERMGEDKLNLPLGGKSVLAMSLAAFEKSETIDEVIVVTKPEKLQEIAALRERYGFTKLTKAVIGGKTRTESALAGVCEADARADVICIHDGARPLVTQEIIADAVHHAIIYLAAAPAIPVKDTLKQANDGEVVATPDRAGLFAVQTPQAFHADIIKGALTAAVASGTAYTDDCAAVEAFGGKVHLSKGSEENLKITTPLDMDIANAILKRRMEAEQ